MPTTAAKPNPQRLAAFVAAGGGAEHFKTTTLVDALTSEHANEKQRLEERFGAATIQRFETVLDYVVALSVTHDREPGLSGSSNADLALALYRAGAGATGRFRVEQLFDVLFGRAAHARAMGNVAQRFGASGETAYHQVLRALVEDVGGPRAARDDGSRYDDERNADARYDELYRYWITDGDGHQAPMHRASPAPRSSGAPMPMSSSMPMQMSSPMPMPSGRP